MNADVAVQLRLLDLQATDTAIAQLMHRRRTLPELAALVEQQKTAAELSDRVVDAETSAADIGDEQRRLENDVDTVRTRTARDQQRLADGGLPSRELESLQHEIVTLARRQSTLEDELIEVMERAEVAEAERVEATAERDAVVAAAQQLVEQRDAAFADIDAALTQHRPERDVIAAQVPAELLAFYERARTQGGTGAALLRQRRCEACRMELSGAELSAVRKAAPDEVVRCENCRAVLVRTAESGL